MYRGNAASSVLFWERSEHQTVFNLSQGGHRPLSDGWILSPIVTCLGRCRERYTIGENRSRYAVVSVYYFGCGWIIIISTYYTILFYLRLTKPTCSTFIKQFPLLLPLLLLLLAFIFVLILFWSSESLSPTSLCDTNWMRNCCEKLFERSGQPKQS